MKHLQAGSWDLPTQSSVNEPLTPTWLKSFCSLTHAEADALESLTSRQANQRGSCGRGRVAGSVAAETAATSQLMKASIHLHSHNIHARERETLPSENKPRLKRKQSARPNKFLLICQGRRGEARRGEECPEWWTPARLPAKCVCLCFFCVCVPVLLHA